MAGPFWHPRFATRLTVSFSALTSLQNFRCHVHDASTPLIHVRDIVPYISIQFQNLRFLFEFEEVNSCLKGPTPSRRTDPYSNQESVSAIIPGKSVVKTNKQTKKCASFSSFVSK